jgi:hypothetical protein
MAVSEVETQCTSTWVDNGYDERCERLVGDDGLHLGFHQAKTVRPGRFTRISVWGELSHWTLPVAEACPVCGTYVWPQSLRDTNQCRHCDQWDALAARTRRS